MAVTEVIDAVRRIIERWTKTETPLITDALAGDNQISVSSTRRFEKGDQFLIKDGSSNPKMENALYVLTVPDRHTITLADANGNPYNLKFNWPVSNSCSVIKTQNNQLVKAVFYGEPDIITDLPAITVQSRSRNSEYLTLRSTKERYEIEITAFVSGTSLEEGDRFLHSIVDTIQTGLKKNFYPLLNDYQTTTILADINQGDYFVKVADTSIFSGAPYLNGYEVIIEDDYNIDVDSIYAICDANTVQLATPIQNNYVASQAIMIKPNRLPFNSWPTNITFGKIYKGTLLKAAVISYFVEEMEDHSDAAFGDTQLK